jgi:putative tricarboxylic transport membrane protein
LNLPMIPLWVRILKIPYWILYPAILTLAIVGAYSVRGSIFDVYMLIGFSAMGYAMRKLEIPAAPLLMAFVLGPQAETALRQSLILSDNSPLIFVERPISAIVLAFALGVVALAIFTRRGGRSIVPVTSVSGTGEVAGEAAAPTRGAHTARIPRPTPEPAPQVTDPTPEPDPAPASHD